MPETPPLLSERHMRLKQCRHRPMLYSTKDIYIGRSLDLYGEFSEGEVHFFGHKDYVFGNIFPFNMIGIPKLRGQNMTGLTEITGPQDWPLEGAERDGGGEGA